VETLGYKTHIINDSVVPISTERYSIVGGCDVLLKHAQLDTRLSAFVVVSTLMHGPAKNNIPNTRVSKRPCMDTYHTIGDLEKFDQQTCSRRSAAVWWCFVTSLGAYTWSFGVLDGEATPTLSVKKIKSTADTETLLYYILRPT